MPRRAALALLYRPETVGFIAKKGRIFGVRECVTEEIISQIGRMGEYALHNTAQNDARCLASSLF